MANCMDAGKIGAYLRTYTLMKRPPPCPYMVSYGGVDQCLSFSLSEAYQYLDERNPYWVVLRPSCPTPQLFTDDRLDSVEDMTFLLSLHTNMVTYREDAYFLREDYNPHRFSKQLGFSHAIPGFNSRLGQSVTFPSASKSRGPCKGYSDWLDSIFSVERIRFAPLGPGKGKSVPRLPIPPVPSSSKPLKKHSLLEDDLVDRDPKNVKWGSTRRLGPVIVSFPNAPIVVTKDVEETPELSDCMITEAVDIEVPAASLPSGVQHIESILRDNLKFALVELCSFVEGKSYETLLADKEGIMASFGTLTRFSRHDLSSEHEELKAVFSKARHVREAQFKVILLEVHDRIAAVWTTLAEFSSKLHHETKAI
ncbi:hypothetical protein LIER_33052 [Lithospermum erythrorhizon]|uniref:Uncharacterized protein n=1 Tax=Lithospermum erythrorhizon TaxID=34254 RepID=A0AAV3RZA6_LITER